MERMMRVYFALKIVSAKSHTENPCLKHQVQTEKGQIALKKVSAKKQKNCA
jgi:hypothetical protein